MEIQEIIVIIIIGGALLYAIYGIVKVFNQTSDSGCSCSSCDLKEHNKELKSFIHKKISKEYS